MHKSILNMGILTPYAHEYGSVEPVYLLETE
jgi:hypothetical protein